MFLTWYSMFFKTARLQYLFLLFILIMPYIAVASPQPTRVHTVNTWLEADYIAATPGQNINIAWHFEMDDGWHVYWKNPGDSGLPAQIDWNPNPHVTFTDAAQIVWPAPHPIVTGPIMSYGYEDHIALSIPLQIKETAPIGQPIQLSGTVRFLMCKDICLPGDAHLTTPLWIDHKAEPNQSVQAFLAQQNWPQHINNHTFEAFTTADGFTLSLPPQLIKQKIRFIPDVEGMIEDLVEQKQKASNLQLLKDEWADETPTHLSGLLFNEDTHTAYYVPNTSIQPATIQRTINQTMLTILIFAFIAGLVLNLMPCVLPVLSIKVLSLLKQAHGSPLPYALSYTGGVIASFGALAGSIIALQASGHALGWGFHLQSPVFVGVLTLLILVLTATMLGAIHLPILFAQWDYKLGNKQTMLNAFFSGVLITAVATPCTVPFMGTAVAYALTAHWTETLLIMGTMGLGLASPYMALSLFPAGLKKLPKPGPWMDTFKIILALPMFGTAIWLWWVFTQLTNFDWVIIFIATILGTGVFLALFVRHSKSRTLQIISFIFITSISSALLSSHKPQATSLQSHTWSEQAVSSAQQAKQNIIVDVTADWCITCKFTENTVLRSKAFHTLVKDHNIQLFKADWTEYSEDITALLQSHGRQGVPLYLVFKEGKEAQILPQLPRTKDFKEALE